MKLLNHRGFAVFKNYFRFSGIRIFMASQTTNVDYSSAFVTCPNADVAKKIARGLVEKKLAACVNIIPNVTSIYTWEGKVEEDTELLMMIKTRTSRVKDLTEFVRSNHPDQVPEVISMKLSDGNPAYLQWILDSVPGK